MTNKEQIAEIICRVTHKTPLIHCDVQCDVTCTEYAEELAKQGYHKTIWHKVVDRDFPPTNKKVLFKLAEYDELTVGFLREDGLFDLETYPGFYGTDADVIAWTELPKYEE